MLYVVSCIIYEQTIIKYLKKNLKQIDINLSFHTSSYLYSIYKIFGLRRKTITAKYNKIIGIMFFSILNIICIEIFLVEKIENI